MQFDRITHQLVRVTLRVFYVCLPKFTGVGKVGLWFGEGLNVFWPWCSGGVGAVMVTMFNLSLSGAEDRSREVLLEGHPTGSHKGKLLHALW